MIRVFKFGGASVKDAEAVRNAVSILSSYGKGKLMLIISAMGKTTNALEKVLKEALDGKYKEATELIDDIKRFHFSIAEDLFGDRDNKVFSTLDNRIKQLTSELQKIQHSAYDESYDRIVHYGELLSTELIADYIIKCGLPCTWFDARELVMTDNRHRDAAIDWQATQERINNIIIPVFDNGDHIALTQGFIGMSNEGKPVTLGREGSDFTASIFSFCMNAEEMVIWKDVPGLLNADPKLMKDAVKLNHISYEEAVELAYYGATIIHPKSIKPLENKFIPLKICSFLHPADDGSLINEDGKDDRITPSFIFKFNQILISISPRDFSFINEKNLHEIFGLFNKHNVKICLMQNSAISFSVCTDNTEKIPDLIEDLLTNFRVKFNENVELITIRHYNKEVADRFRLDRRIFMEQKSRQSLQMVVRQSIKE